MIKRIGILIALIFGGIVLLFSFQNFTYKYKVAKMERKVASDSDFNALIVESQSSQNQLAQELEKKRQPERIKEEGLLSRDGEKRRVIIEGTGGAVAVKGSASFPENPHARQHVDDKKNLERLSQEIDSDIFGFGEYYKSSVRHAKLTEEKWHALYKDMKVNVDINVTLLRDGIFE